MRRKTWAVVNHEEQRSNGHTGEIITRPRSFTRPTANLDEEWTSPRPQVKPYSESMDPNHAGYGDLGTQLRHPEADRSCSSGRARVGYSSLGSKLLVIRTGSTSTAARRSAIITLSYQVQSWYVRPAATKTSRSSWRTDCCE